MKPKIKLKNNGFSLLELIVAITVAIILFIIITLIYSANQRVFYNTDSKSELTQNGRVILDRLVRELRQTLEIVTTLPIDNSNPELIPDEIEFQDGHDTSEIKYIRYYLDGTNLKKQIIAYYFVIDPDTYVYYNAIGPGEDVAVPIVLEDRIIGEYVQDIDFWGESLININLSLIKGTIRETIYTVIYGRNS